MPKYIIEREIPGAGKLTSEQLRGLSQKSRGVLRQLGSEIQWLESYVTDDKVYGTYLASPRGNDPRARPAGRFSPQPDFGSETYD